MKTPSEKDLKTLSELRKIAIGVINEYNSICNKIDFDERLGLISLDHEENVWVDFLQDEPTNLSKWYSSTEICYRDMDRYANQI